MANALNPRGSWAQTAPNWSAVILAGIIAGIVFALWEMILNPLFLGNRPWAPVRMIAGIAMGQSVVPPPDTFALLPILVGVLVHLALSIIYAIVLAYIIQRMSLGTSLVAGAIYGLVLYYLNFYLIANIAFGWFKGGQNWFTLIGHALFGLVLAWAYKGLAHHETRISLGA